MVMAASPMIVHTTVAQTGKSGLNKSVIWRKRWNLLYASFLKRRFASDWSKDAEAIKKWLQSA